MEAEQLASKELQDYPYQHDIVPVDQHSMVQVNVASKTVTCNLDITILIKKHFPALQKYAIKKFNWTLKIFEPID